MLSSHITLKNIIPTVWLSKVQRWKLNGIGLFLISKLKIDSYSGKFLRKSAQFKLFQGQGDQRHKAGTNAGWVSTNCRTHNHRNTLTLWGQIKVTNKTIRFCTVGETRSSGGNPCHANSCTIMSHIRVLLESLSCCMTQFLLRLSSQTS